MPASLLIIILFILLEVLNYVYFYLFFNIKYLRNTLVLGVFIHEFSHYLLCIFTGAPVYEFEVASLQGHVKHGNSKIPLIGNMLISLAPLFIGTTILVLIIVGLSSLTLADFAVMAQDVNALQPEVILTNIGIVLGTFNYQGLWFWVGFVILFSILATFKPSHQDLKNVAVVLILFVYLSYYEFMAPFNLLIIFVFILANLLQVGAILILLPIYAVQRWLRGVRRS